jgi:hypothetical protein
MAFSFPSSPTVNQTYTFNSSIWKFNGKGWAKDSAGGASVTNSATAPASPTDGAMWLENESGDLYVYGGGNWILTGVNPGPSFSGSYNDLTDKPTITSVVPSAISDQNNTSTGYFDLPSGTTAQRPATAFNGATRLNTTTNYLEIYNSGNWVNLIYVGIITATYTGSPVVVSAGGYSNVTFNSAGTFTVTNAPAGAVLELVIVAGGGGGGTCMGGGGGAGGLIYNTTFNPTLNSAYSITIGAGGAGAPNRNARGSSGSNTTAFGLTAIGGGGAGSWEIAAILGGSGGGAPNGKAAGAGTAGQGNSGGGSPADTAGSGGGGASAAAISTSAGPGGAGSIIPNIGTYAGGGGGGTGSGSYGSTGTRLGGIGGGGNGGAVSSAGSNGSANTGGGGGGGSYDGGDYIGGTGGSGVVIVRYRSS